MARKKQPDMPSPGAPGWMATYGDLVTLLLCFFVLLFSMSSVDSAKFKALISAFDDNIGLMPGGKSLQEGTLISSGVSQMSELDVYFYNMDDQHPTVKPATQKQEEEKQKLEQAAKIAEKVSDLAANSNILDDVEITYTSQYVQLSLKGAILFDSGKAELKKDAVLLISKIGDILKNYEQCKIAIEGHTDNVPINTSVHKNNWYLSSARAITVADYLIETKKFDPSNVSAVGYGEYRPIDTNSTSEGRAKNRRVEIKILNTLNNSNN